MTLKKLAPIFALMAATGLTTVMPEVANAQTPIYNQVPGPTTTAPVSADNYYEAAIPPGYYGPAMTQQGINEVAAQPIGNPLRYARKGFTQATLRDGEHIGIEYNLDPNGRAYIMDPDTFVYDLNNPADLQRWNQTVNSWERANADQQAAYETAMNAGNYYGPAVYMGAFTPCWHRHGGFELAIGVGGFGVEVFDPYAYDYGRPIIVEPVFYGRNWAYERMIYEREMFYNRMHYPYYGGGGVNIFVNIGGRRGIWDEHIPGHMRPWDGRVYGGFGGRGFERGREYERGREFERGRVYQPHVEPRREIPRVVEPRRDFPNGRQNNPYIHNGAGAQQPVRQMPPREIPRTFEPRGGQQGGGQPYQHGGQQGGGQQPYQHGGQVAGGHHQRHG